MNKIKELIDKALKENLFGKNFQFRPNQRETIEFICNEYIQDNNATIILDAPTGTGKSIIAMWSSYILKELGNQGYIIASDKSLQNQYERDFSHYGLNWPSIKGVDNYDCDVNGLPFSLGECKMRGFTYDQAERLHCSQTCNYIQFRKKAIKSPVTLLNYSFWLIQQNYVNPKLALRQYLLQGGSVEGFGGPPGLDASVEVDDFDNFFPFKKRDFCFFDEAHKVDEIVQQHFSPILKKFPLLKTATLIKFLGSEGIKAPRVSKAYVEDLMDQILKEESNEKLAFYLNKLKVFLAGITKCREGLSKRARFKFGASVDSNLPKKWKNVFSQMDSLKDVHCKLEDYLEIIENEGLQTMLFSKNLQDGEIKLMCLSESTMIKKHLHKRAGFKVFMSATIGDPRTYSKIMGIENAKFIRLSNGFTYDKSPIVFVDRLKMSMQHKKENLPKAIVLLDQILAKHKNQRGLIHTGSYEFSQYITQHSKHVRRIIEYNKSSEKEEAIIKFKNGVNGVIMGPSILEGLDFADEVCRFQIFFKVPYPSLGDPLTLAKIKKSPGWYDWKTGITIQQGAGRSIRNKGDWAVTYILDACFGNLINKTEFFPDNFKQRIKKIK
tara:strand:+ start:16091 stop:17914 length:1824 start_codon:yes stop_codon:yes gene_type:complete